MDPTDPPFPPDLEERLREFAERNGVDRPTAMDMIMHLYLHGPLGGIKKELVKLNAQLAGISRALGLEADAQPEPREVDALTLELGRGLVPLIESLLQDIPALRGEFANEWGFPLPPVRVLDNLTLQPRSYVVKVRDVAASEGLLDTDEPLADRLREAVLKALPDLLGIQEVSRLLAEISRTHPALVLEVVPRRLSLPELRQVLRLLLRDGVPIRDLVTILEELADLPPGGPAHPEEVARGLRSRLASD